jgi:serpin B
MKKIILLISLLFLAFPLYADNDVQQTNITGLNKFAFNLYQQIVNKSAGTNIAVSPFGVSSLLNILYIGANGDTQQEIGNALGLTTQTPNGLDINSMTHSFISESSQNSSSTDSSQFIFGNALWLQSGMQLNPPFTQRLNTLNGGLSYNVDFVKNPSQSADQINAWVANLTNNYIKNLITPGLINDQTRVILTNAIYFKGLWENAFDPSITHPGDFTLDNGNVIKVPLMSQSHSFGYAENDSFRMLVLPYKNSSLTMAILLPKQPGQFSQFVKSFNLDTFNDLSAKEYAVDKMTVTLPKFIIQSTFANLENNLKSMGINKAFTSSADFSAMTSSQGIKVSKVIQKVYVGVDEKGTIAAAATGMSIMATTVMPMSFNADHPFMFLIYDKNSHLILFMGDVMDPAE